MHPGSSRAPHPGLGLGECLSLSLDPSVWIDERIPLPAKGTSSSPRAPFIARLRINRSRRQRSTSGSQSPPANDRRIPSAEGPHPTSSTEGLLRPSCWFRRPVGAPGRAGSGANGSRGTGCASEDRGRRVSTRTESYSRCKTRPVGGDTPSRFVRRIQGRDFEDVRVTVPSSGRDALCGGV